MKLQTSHHISAKSVNICDSYSKFSKITKKHISVHYRHRHDWLPSVRPCEWQDVSTPKVCVQNVHRVLERKLEDADSTDRFVDGHLLEIFLLFDQARLQLVDVTNLAAVHTLLQLLTNLVVDSGLELSAGVGGSTPSSCLQTLIFE